MENEPIVTAPLPETPAIPPPKKRPIGLLIGILVLSVVILLYLFLSKKTRETIQTELPPIPTPTPIRIPSAIATESAFLQLETGIASLSGALKGFVPVDQTLIPPAVIRPLGFGE